MPEGEQSPQPISADAIAAKADLGENISRYFTRKGKMMPPIQREKTDQQRLARRAG
jgi:hypothetical protein